MEWGLVIQIVVAAAAVAVMLSAACDELQREDKALRARRAKWERLQEQRRWLGTGHTNTTDGPASPEAFTQRLFEALSRRANPQATSQETDQSAGSDDEAP